MTQEEAIQKMMDQSDAMLQANTDDYVSALLDKWDEFQARLEADILKIHSELPEDATYADFVRFQGDAKISKAIGLQLEKLHVSVDADRMEALVQQYKDAYNHSAWMLDEATPPEVDIDYQMAQDSQIRQFVAEDWPNEMFVTRNAREFYFLAQDIKRAVTGAMLNGQSVQQLSKTIQDIIGDEDSDYRYRSKRIATTEMLRAANLGSNALYDQNEDVIDDWEWITRGLMAVKEVCDYCLERRGKRYDEVSEIAAAQGLPVDAPIHPFCACRWNAIPKSPLQLIGPVLGKGIEDFGEIKYNPQAYSKWAEQNLVGAQ